MRLNIFHLKIICIPINFNNPNKTDTQIRNIIFQFKHAPHKLKKVYFLIKPGLTGSFKIIICIQIQLPIRLDLY